MTMGVPLSPAPRALGIDVGGTSSRWVVMDGTGREIAQGHGPGFSGTEMFTSSGADRVASCIAQLAARVPAPVHAVCAGVTGIGDGSPSLHALLRRAFALPGAAVQLASDVEIACRAAFAPGSGYLVYAGTGSIAAFIDEAGVLHRAGGRGVLLDDAGGGYWMAREALRRLWRREDELPGAWRHSLLAQRLFAAVGGETSIHAARFLMERDRGEVGCLALHLAECASGDELAREILGDAGVELARLANAMRRRYGPRPIVFAGRAALLHPLIAQAAQAQLAGDVAASWRTLAPHAAAAKCALALIHATDATDVTGASEGSQS